MGEDVSCFVDFYFCDEGEFVEVGFSEIFVCVLDAEGAGNVDEFFEFGEATVFDVGGEVLVDGKVGVVVHLAGVEWFSVFGHVNLFIKLVLVIYIY